MHHTERAIEKSERNEHKKITKTTTKCRRQKKLRKKSNTGKEEDWKETAKKNGVKMQFKYLI